MSGITKLVQRLFQIWIIALKVFFYGEQ